MSEQVTQILIGYLIEFSTNYLIPFMLVIFVLGVAFRILVYYTVRRELYYVREFSKRVKEYYSGQFNTKKHHSFFGVTKTLMHQAFHDVFEMRRRFMRRKPDHIMSIGDRLFLVEDGVKRLVKDTLNQIKYLNKETRDPRLIDVSKAVFDVNPVFNKIFGIIPLALVNEFLNILPGLFIIGGIFGTFLGIMKALPELGGMNLSDAEETKYIMDMFLVKISFSMSTSIVGILLSVMMTTVNTIFGPDSIFYKLVNQFTDTLNLIWNETSTNDILKPGEIVQTGFANKFTDKKTKKEAKNQKKPKKQESRRSQMEETQFIQDKRATVTQQELKSKTAPENAQIPKNTITSGKRLNDIISLKEKSKANQQKAIPQKKLNPLQTKNTIPLKKKVEEKKDKDEILEEELVKKLGNIKK